MKLDISSSKLEDDLRHIQKHINTYDAKDAHYLASRFKDLLQRKNQKKDKNLFLFYEIVFDLSLVYTIDRQWLARQGLQLIDLAKQQGNSRIESLLYMQRGVLFIYINQEEEALKSFETGNFICKKLDDNDLTQALCPYFIIYQNILGNLQVIPEQMKKLGTLSSLPPSYFSRFFFLTFLSLALSVRGESSLSCQVLLLSYKFSKKAKASHTFFSVLTLFSTIYCTTREMDKARKCFEELNTLTKENNLPEAQFWQHRALAFYHFIQKDYELAEQEWEKALQNITAKTDTPYTTRPIFLKMLYALTQKGKSKLVEQSYKSIKANHLHSRNCYLRAHAHIINAREQREVHGKLSLALQELELAKALLINSGANPILMELHLEFALCAEQNQQKKQVHLHLTQARKYDLDNYSWLYPQQLLPYKIKVLPRSKESILWEHLERFLSLNSMLENAANFTELLNKALKLLCFFFKSESGFILREEQDKFQCIIGKQAQDKGTAELARLTSEQLNQQDPFIDASFENTGLYEKSIRLYIPIELDRKLIFSLKIYPELLQDIDQDSILALASNIAHTLQTNIRLHLNGQRHVSALNSFSSQKKQEGGILWQSPAMKQVIELANIAAQTDASVLLLGETGTGKTVLAEYIHQRGRRKKQPFVAVDVGSLSENLIESELFGHEKGAFTGAQQRKKGYIEISDTGTLFLDEIGEIPMPIQAKMLRLLQDKVFARVGGTKELASDFRLISATNIKFSQAIKEQKFREDLFYRINIIPITLPPLRKRPEDIEALVEHFFAFFAQKHNLPQLSLPSQQKDAVLSYAWPGNVRELRNYAERATIIQNTDIGIILSAEPFFASTEEESNVQENPAAFAMTENFEQLPSMAELQKSYIEYLFAHTNKKISGKNSVSEILQMKRTTLYNRMKKLGIEY